MVHIKEFGHCIVLVFTSNDRAANRVVLLLFSLLLILFLANVSLFGHCLLVPPKLVDFYGNVQSQP